MRCARTFTSFQTALLTLGQSLKGDPILAEWVDKAEAEAKRNEPRPEQPIIPIYHYVNADLRRSNVKGIKENPRNNVNFRDVYVAELNLEWSQTCGGLCGAGYKRNKVVVLDATGNVLRMFLDAPENRGAWVS